MGKESPERWLTAVLIADVVGYSRLIGQDEDATLAAFENHREGLIIPMAAQHNGTIVKWMGDGFLMEFASVVAAVSFAAELQTAMREHNQDVSPDQQIIFRIGINLGDVVHENDDIYGEGVNIAARLEPLAEPGGICVSSKVHDDVRDRLKLQFFDLGPIQLKNIVRPIHVWGWNFDNIRSALPQTMNDEFDVDLPEMPSIAVLPFDNMSGNEEHGFVADGLTENIILTLSTSPHLIVISRNSSSTYKNKPKRVQDIGSELGVRYIIEGSIQFSGTNARITVQLIDAVNDQHLWAEKYDRSLEDVFGLQDEISHKIAVELHAKLTYGEHVRDRTTNPEGFRLFDLGRVFYNQFSPEGFQKAEKYWTELYEMDPDKPEGNTLMGWLCWMKVFINLTDEREAELKLAREYAQKALSVSKTYGNAFRLLGVVEALSGNLQEANRYLDRAVELGPSDSEAVSISGAVKLFSGETELAIKLFRQSMRMEPYYPTWIISWLGVAMVKIGKLDEAKSINLNILKTDEPVFQEFSYNWLAIIAMLQGDEVAAKDIIKKLFSLFPQSTVDGFYRLNPIMFEDQTWPQEMREILTKCREAVR